MRKVTMQRRHFQFIADVIKPRIGDDQAVQSLAIAFAKALKSTNPLFSPERFLTACGVQDYDCSWM